MAYVYEPVNTTENEYKYTSSLPDDLPYCIRDYRLGNNKSNVRSKNNEASVKVYFYLGEMTKYTSF